MPEPTPISPDNLKEKERIEAFNQSSFARLLNMTIIEAHDGYARVVMTCGQALNPHAVMHGGAIFAVADQAFGIRQTAAMQSGWQSRSIPSILPPQPVSWRQLHTGSQITAVIPPSGGWSMKAPAPLRSSTVWCSRSILRFKKMHR